MKMITLVLALMSWGAYAQHDHAGHEEKKTTINMAVFNDKKLGVAYEHYTYLTNALVASNSKEAKIAAAKLHKSLTGVGKSEKASGEAEKISSTDDLDKQRKAFSLLSDEMKLLITESKLSSGELYVVYCPMADNNKGASWLSNEKQIKNPYFGHAMLKCGSVKETIQ